MKLESRITKVRNGVTYDWAYYGQSAGGILTITDSNGGSVSVQTQSDTPSWLESFFHDCKNELLREQCYEMQSMVKKLLNPENGDIPNS